MTAQKLLYLTLAIVLIVVPQSFSDSTDFKITDYIPQKFEDFQLFVDGGGGFSSSNRETDEETLKIDSESDQSDFKFSFTSFYSHETIQSKLNVRFFGGFNVSNSSSDYFYAKEIQANARSEIRIYDTFRRRINLNLKIDREDYILNDLFAKASFGFRFNQSRLDRERFTYDNRDSRRTRNDRMEIRVDTTINDTDNSITGNGFAYDFKLAIGLGRVYIGKYAATANYFIKDLKKKELLKRSLTKSEMIALTDLIHYYRNKKAIDNRLLRIETFEVIIKYLRENNLIEEEGMHPAFVLQDIWDFAPRDRREFGLQATLGVDYRLRLDNSKNNQKGFGDRFRLLYSYPISDTTQIDTIQFTDVSNQIDRILKENRKENISDLLATITYNKPIGFDWQFSIEFDGVYRLYRTSNSKRTDNLDLYEIVDTDFDFDNEMSAAIKIALTYLPTTRTKLVFLITERGHRIDHVLSSSRVYADNTFKKETTSTSKYNSLSINTNLVYRISIPTTLTVRAGYSNDSKNRERLTFSTSIRHYIF